MMSTNYKVGVLGASGYTGQELVALLVGHPGFELVFATSASMADKRVPGTDLVYEYPDGLDLGVDLVFSCLPTGESGAWARKGHAAGARVIDLSNDLRPAESGAVYGLPELWRIDVAKAGMVANPGCYPTGILLGLAPLMVGRLPDFDRPVIINAASGVTGAGRAPKRELLFAEVSGDFRAYGVGNRHRHVPEIKAGLTRLAAGKEVSFVFTPHLLPISRGILVTMYVPLPCPSAADDAVEALYEEYRAEPFVEFSHGQLPGLREVVGRNMALLGAATVDDAAPGLLLVVALDNLLKGAAGQAVQNANLMFGFDEAEGLPR